jgi:hypothetical protein
MESVTCTNCSTSAPANAFFCPSCATQIKCKKCSAPLLKNAKACISCGAFTESANGFHQSENAINTIKFKETKEERTYEVAFTNHVSKEVSGLVVTMMKDNLKNKALPQHDSLLQNPEATENSDTINVNESPIREPNHTSVHDNILKTDNIPPLNDVEMTLTCSEAEWMAIYAFYISNNGLNVFSREAVQNNYKNKRFTETRLKNFASNWKTLFKSYITTVKENEFRFKAEGIKLVTHLLVGDKKEPARSKKATAGKSKAPQKAIPKNAVPEEFDVFNKKKKLEELFKEKAPGKNTAFRLLLIAYYIMKVNESDHFTEGNVDYAYRILNLNSRPNFLHQTLLNLASQKVWFEQLEEKGKGTWKLTRIGEIFVEDKLPEKPQ